MKKQQWLIIGILLLTVAAFFYPIFRGNVPFPGDLLVGHYFPYNTLSYNGYAPGAVPHKAQGPDVIRELYPWKYFAIESLKQFHIPFWNPYNFSGNPLMANFQSAVFYPLNILFFILPFTVAWTLFIFLIPFFAALFTYLYLREIGVHKIPALYGGITFAFSAYMVVWMEYGNIGHTMLWLPLGLLLVEKLIKKIYPRSLLFLIAVLTIALLGGYIQGYFYIVITLCMYAAVKLFPFKRVQFRRFILLGISFVVPVFLTLFQFLPTLSLFSQSSRSNYSLATIDKLLNPWWYAITVIAPDFFGHPASRNYWFDGTYIERVSFFGVIPFILALTALFYWKKCIEVRIFGALFIATFLLSFNLFLTKFFYLIPIPVISTTVPTRLLCLFVFSGAILSAVAFHEMEMRPKQKHTYYAVMIAIILLFAGWVAVLFGAHLFSGEQLASNLAVSKRNLIIPTLMTGGYCLMLFFYQKTIRLKQLFVLLLCVLTFFDLFRFFHKITPFSPPEYIYPITPVVSYLQHHAGIDRFWGYGDTSIDTNFQMVDGTYSTDGNDPLHVRAYTEFVESSKTGRVPDTLPRPDATIASGYGPGDLKTNLYRQKVLNLLGVRYVVHKFDGAGPTATPDEVTFDTKTYKLAWQLGPYQIYENKKVVPRAFLTADYRVLKKNDIIPQFYSSDFDEERTVLLEENPHIPRRTLLRHNVAVLSYAPHQVVIKTVADADALLFLSDTMYPGWTAFVDAESRPILTADYAFRAVPVPKGTHIVRFVYQSQQFNRGLALSGLFLAGLIVCFYLARKKSL